MKKYPAPKYTKKNWRYPDIQMVDAESMFDEIINDEMDDLERHNEKEEKERARDKARKDKEMNKYNHWRETNG